MKKKIISTVVLMMILVTSNTLAGANAIETETNQVENMINDKKISSLENKEEVYVFGANFSNINGDWEYYGDHAIRMCMSLGNDDCRVFYEIDIGYNQGRDLEVGIYFYDDSLWPFAEGPNLYIYDFIDQLWHRIKKGCGNQDELEWKWYTIHNSYRYIRPDGQVHLKIYCDGMDQTVLDTVGVKYNPIISNLSAFVDEPLIWTDVEPFSELTGLINIQNVGDPDSLLDWEVFESLEWVSCSPTYGKDLEKDDIQTVTVTATAPEKNGKTLSGKIKLINSEYPNNFEIINIEIKTKKYRDRSIFINLFEKFPILEQLFLKFKM